MGSKLPERNLYPLYLINAFTDRRDAGNPACVCYMEAFPAEADMQHLAALYAQPATAFVVRETEARYHIRWFAPQAEIRLCGHASFAASYMLLYKGFTHARDLEFSYPGGTFSSHLELSGQHLLDFPAYPPDPVSEVPDLIEQALGVAPLEFHRSTVNLAVLPDETTLRNLRPDFTRLEQLRPMGLIVTARSTQPGIDFVSRFFSPAPGVQEDQVTGSAHAVLTPFWARRLHKKRMKAQQLSARGGELVCIDRGERIGLGGACYTALIGFGVGGFKSESSVD